MPHSQTLAAKNLFLAVLVEALSTLQTTEDYEWFMSEDAEAYMCLLNLSEADIFRLRLRLLLGLLDPKRYRESRLNASRYGDRGTKHDAAERSQWPPTAVALGR